MLQGGQAVDAPEGFPLGLHLQVLIDGLALAGRAALAHLLGPLVERLHHCRTTHTPVTITWRCRPGAATHCPPRPLDWAPPPGTVVIEFRGRAKAERDALRPVIARFDHLFWVREIRPSPGSALATAAARPGDAVRPSAGLLRCGFRIRRHGLPEQAAAIAARLRADPVILL